MTFRAVMFIYRSISFFNYVIDPNFDMNIDLVSGFLSAIDSFASGLYGSNIQSINFGANSIFTLDVPLTENKEKFKIITFSDKSSSEDEIKNYLNTMRIKFFESYSPQDVLEWDGNVLRFIGYRKIINKILNIKISGETAVEPSQEDISSTQSKYEDGWLFILADLNFNQILEKSSNPTEISANKILKNIAVEMQFSNKDTYDVVLPMLDNHQIAYIICQKSTNPVFLKSINQSGAIYAILCYIVHEKYQGFLPKIISLVQPWAANQLREVWGYFFTLDKYLTENLKLQENPFSTIAKLKNEELVIFNSGAITRLKNSDHLIYALLADKPIALIGDKVQAKELIHQMLFFTTHRAVKIVEYPSEILTEKSVDIVSIPSRDAKHYKEFIQVDLEKQIVKGGESNKFCETLAQELLKIQDPVFAAHALQKKMNWLISKATLIRNLSWGTSISVKDISAIRGDMDPEAEKIVLRLAGGHNSYLQNLVDHLITHIPLKSLLLDENFIKYNESKILVSAKIPVDKRTNYIERITKIGNMLLGPKIMTNYLN